MENNAERRRPLPTEEAPTELMSKLLYSALVWSVALVFKRNVRTILRPQKTIALRTEMAYRTVSTAAIMVAAGIIRAHLLAFERTRRDEISSEPDRASMEKEIREEVFNKWQSECYQEPDTGRWTWRLIRNVKTWFNRKG
ncbi:unnamed protein product [Macrosiphum euphorbiae]|uniref:Uncharacterized protein n=1 Tax=Macrosiphum euphorbiae TaxID=13131 RepID=A0AAV0X277_9HEMI|nr:unnamed protein product [Macrosiphum euphorbiae]